MLFTENRILAFLTIFAFSPLFLYTYRSLKSKHIQNTHESPILSFDPDTCTHFLLDMGTNVGIQIRKLFEPELYPDPAGVIQYYDEYFGSAQDRRRDVCVFGFEPNPLHQPRLQKLQETYNKQGWKLHIFNAGVGPVEGDFPFETDNDKNNDYWGAKVALEDKDFTVYGTKTVRTNDTVKVMRPSFVMYDYVIPRINFLKGVNHDPMPKVVVKLDVEGFDYLVMKDLILTGAVCYIDFFYGEHLSGEFMGNLQGLLKEFGKDCPPLKMIYLDDEGFHNTDFLLPGEDPPPELAHLFGESTGTER